jgi:hypothetical protein
VDLADHPLSEKMAAGLVKPLQLLRITEVDAWEIAAERGRSVLDLLREKTSNPETTELSFNHFIYLKGETFQNHHSQWQASQFSEIMEADIAYFRDLGLPEDIPDADEGAPVVSP